jgi:hypothetical protein
MQLRARAPPALAAPTLHTAWRAWPTPQVWC